MTTPDVFTLGFFTRRLADLCLRGGMCGLPKDDVSRHVLFTSMVASLPVETPLDERTVDAQLARWVAASGIKALDHVTLRRHLVDAGYLARRMDGSSYRAAAEPPGRPRCEAGVTQTDLVTVLQVRREEMARRKSEFLAKTVTQAQAASREFR